MRFRIALGRFLSRLGREDHRLFFTFRTDHHRLALTLCGGLLLHRLLHRRRGLDVLNLDGFDRQPPVQRLIGDTGFQAGLDHLA